MKTNRRNFLRTTVVAGAGAFTAGAVSSCSRQKGTTEMLPEVRTAVLASHSQKFNMTGYSASPLAKVRIGFIGLGQRGPGAVERMTSIEGVEIAALCDKYTDRVDKMQAMIAGYGLPQAKSFSGTEEAWKGLCDDPEIDLVYICTPWAWHTPMAVYAMEHGSMWQWKCRQQRRLKSAGSWWRLPNGQRCIACSLRTAAMTFLNC